jgi:hypothetical protein
MRNRALRARLSWQGGSPVTLPLPAGCSRFLEYAPGSTGSEKSNGATALHPRLRAPPNARFGHNGAAGSSGARVAACKTCSRSRIFVTVDELARLSSSMFCSYRPRSLLPT